MSTNRDPDLVLALQQISETARRSSGNRLQVILELADDALADRPRQSQPIADRVAEALRIMAAARARLRFADRHASVEACDEATSVIRDLAALAGVEIPAEQKEAA